MTASTHQDTERVQSAWPQEPLGGSRRAALLNAIASVVAETDTGSLVRIVVTAAATLVEADYGAFAILGARGDVVDLVAHGVGSEDAQQLGLLPERSGLLARLISANGVTRLDDVTLHAGTVDFSPRHPRMGALLGMPITTRGAAIGSSSPSAGHPARCRTLPSRATSRLGSRSDSSHCTARSAVMCSISGF